MLATYYILLNLAFAQIHCTPPGDNEKNQQMLVCGEARQEVFAHKNTKVKNITLLLQNKERGFERSLSIKNPGLTLEQLNNKQFDKSGPIKKELNKIKKDWQVREQDIIVTQFEINQETKIYSDNNLQKPVLSSSLIEKANRGIASEGPPEVGGVRRALGK